jgi:hypothetical protein
MKIYNYHPETYELVGDSFADPNPLEPGEYLIPAHATSIEPLIAPPGKVVFFDESKQAWELKDIPEDTAPVNPFSESYQYKRAMSYPLIGDQLDALFHAGVFPPEMAAQIQAVKDQFPKE